MQNNHFPNFSKKLIVKDLLREKLANLIQTFEKCL